MAAVKNFLSGMFTPVGVAKPKKDGIIHAIVCFALSFMLLSAALIYGVYGIDRISMLRLIYSDISRDATFYWADEVKRGVIYREHVVCPSENGKEAVAFAPGQSRADVAEYPKSIEIHDGFAVLRLYGFAFDGDVDIDLFTRLTNGKSTMSTMYDIVGGAEDKLYGFLTIAMIPVAFVLNVVFLLLFALFIELFSAFFGLRAGKFGERVRFLCRASVVPAILAAGSAFLYSVSFVIAVYCFAVLTEILALTFFVKDRSQNL